MKDLKKHLMVLLSLLAIFFFLSSAYMWGKLQGMSQKDSVRIESVSDQINLTREEIAYIRSEMTDQLEQARNNVAEGTKIAYDATAAILQINDETGETTVRVDFRIRSYVYAQKVTILCVGSEGATEVEVVPDQDRVSVELTIPQRAMTEIWCRIEPSAGDVIQVIDISPEEMLKERFTASAGSDGIWGSGDGESDIYTWYANAYPQIRNEYGNDEKLKLTECVLRFAYGDHIQEYDLMEFLVDEGGVQVYSNDENNYSFSFTDSKENNADDSTYIIARDGYGTEYIFR